jgi:ATP-binding cassette subfamily B protein
MADRAHGMQVLRAVPHTVLGLAQAVLELALTAASLAWLAPEAWPWALAMATVAVAVPLGSMPLLGERDLRVRTHAAALAGFYLDALLGLVPVRAHRAERALRREHEALLVEWSRSMQVWIRGVLSLDALQGTMALALAVVFLARHFQVQGGALGSDLLLVFWTLKVPALGRRLAHLCELLPAQRNALARLLEPLTAPGARVGEEAAAAAAAAVAAPVAVMPSAGAAPALAERGWSIAIEQGAVRAGGHEILREVDLRIEAGEQVAIVGVSGAGKSSLLGLLLGWHRLAEGRLAINGQPVAAEADGTIEALRPQIAWVDPAVQLWNRSLLDNLLYATSDEGLTRIGAASDAARVREVAARLPQGLQTLLGEGGGLLSGGEGQRVRLARALLQPDARLVLLDEPFRGLDRPQRQALMAEARRWWRGRTLLCVTHDVGETLQFARVLVVEDGRILEDGAPDALAAQPTRYRALLEAEAELQAHAWGREPWRRLALRQGLLIETDAAPVGAMPPPAAPLGVRA